jgi:hypothetical protein
MSYDPTDLRLEFAFGLSAEMEGGEGGFDCLLPPTSFAFDGRREVIL